MRMQGSINEDFSEVVKKVIREDIDSNSDEGSIEDIAGAMDGDMGSVGSDIEAGIDDETVDDEIVDDEIVDDEIVDDEIVDDEIVDDAEDTDEFSVDDEIVDSTTLESVTLDKDALEYLVGIEFVQQIIDRASEVGTLTRADIEECCPLVDDAEEIVDDAEEIVDDAEEITDDAEEITGDVVDDLDVEGLEDDSDVDGGCTTTSGIVQ